MGQLDAEWHAILAGYGVDILHMKVLYRDLGKAKADALVVELADCIKRRTNKTFGVAVFWKDWKALNKEFRLKEELGNPFAFAAFGCLAHLQDWAQKPERNTSMADIPCMFEAGSEGMHILWTLAKTEFGIPRLEGDKSVVPLQVADFVAWNNYRHMNDIQAMEGRRPAAIEQLRKTADVGTYFGMEHIRELAIRGGIAVR